jgi:hypothetical protein
MNAVSILFAARNSVYKTIPGLDVWDEDRDALNWHGGNPGIFHPPCRLFSKWLRQFSKAPSSEKLLAHWAVDQVRTWGGVLEHPACSLLWDEARLPSPGTRDKHGLSIAVNQLWWGHKLYKTTWLYICGAATIPEIPFTLKEPTHAYRTESPHRIRISSAARQATPIEFAKWLVSVAERCEPAKII